MDNSISKITYGVISILVIVLLVSTVVYPVIESTQTEQRTVANNANLAFTMDSPDGLIVSKLYEEGTSTVIGISVNGYETAFTGSANRVLVVGSDFIIFAYTNSNVSIYGVDSLTSENYTESGWSTLEINEGVITATTGDTVKTHGTRSTFMYCASESGDYCEKLLNASTPTYINPDAFIVFSGDLNLSAEGQSAIRSRFVSYGTYDSLSDGFIIGNGVGLGTTPVLTVPTSQDEGQPYIKVSGSLAVKTTYTVSDVPIEFNGTSSTVRIIAPIEYTMISDNDSMIISLLGVIPLIMFIIPVMLAVRLITTRRD